MLQREMEALDREDFEASSTAPEDVAPSTEQSAEPSSAGNNNSNAGPSSPANVSADPEFARLLREASAQFPIDWAALDLSDAVFQ